MRRPPPRRAPRGAAIVTVLLIVTLATVVVSSLFWRQHVAVRSVENRLAMAQTRWIERAAIDYARLVLALDRRQSAVDYVGPGEVWSTPVQDTRLDETITGGARVDDRERTPALLAGQIQDAQARINLNNILVGGALDLDELESFRRLLTLLGKSPALANQLLGRLMRAQPVPAGLAATIAAGAGTQSPAGSGQAAGAAQPTGSGQASSGAQATVAPDALRMRRLADLLEVPGFDPDTVQALEPFVIFLPASAGKTKVNINTAPAEVIAARLLQFDGGVDAALGAARAFVARRERERYYREVGAASTAMQLPNQSSLPPQQWSVASDYFLLRGVIRFERVVSRTDTLLARRGTQNVEVQWQDRY